MKDPFGRLTTKRQQEYAALCQSLKDSGISSRENARALLANIRNRTLAIGGVVVLLSALTVLLLPKLSAPLLLVSAVCLIWLLAIGAKSYQLIGRYMREELEDDA